MNRRQQHLFDESAAPWVEDFQSEALVATVVFPGGPEEPFDYLVPERLSEALEPGRRVRVPLGRGDRPVVGYCVALGSRPLGGRKLKPVTSVVDRATLVGPPMLELTQWIAGHYLCPWGQVLEAVVPTGVRQQAGTRESVLLVPAEGIAERLTELKLPPKQAQVLARLTGAGQPLAPEQLARMAGCTLAPVAALRKKGMIVATRRRQMVAAPQPAATAPEPALVLGADQRLALEAICRELRAARHAALLLFGVTGSGKTEVYMQAIAETVSYGRQAIVLVPEISLTPQTVERFRSRFGSVAVLHSHLSDAERHRQWQRIAAGAVPVVVGARSAVFAPTPRPGLIVIDEEHETSFKQETAPRYHARDVALARARREQIPLVLGSATPSLESWLRAQRGEYRLLRLPERVMQRAMPHVGTIDLRYQTQRRSHPTALSLPLRRAMEQALADGGQVILLLNRRGFATHIQCPACGLVFRCPACELPLTHHRSAEIALCHYCGYQVPTPAGCPKCQSAAIRYWGRGTQRLEAEVRALFPGFRALRMDSDSMLSAQSYEQTLAAFRSGEAQILLGTQMIAKGLDFPNVTLVGVVNADTALHLPDFRAAERTFQLLAQVAGRTGRGPRGGRVLVQTLNPDHAAIRAAVNHDFEAFAAGELPLREQAGYPPFGAMIRLVVRGPQQASAAAVADALAEGARQALAGEPAARVLGPAPAPLAKLRDLYRFQVQLQSPQLEPLGAAVRQLRRAAAPPEPIQWIADVDPVSML